MLEINAATALGDLLTPETGTWHLDRERSWLAFSIRQFGAATKGHFAACDGEVTTAEAAAHEVTFRTTAISQAGDGWLADGELALCGVAGQVPATVKVTGVTLAAARPARIAVEVAARVSRRAFGVRVPFSGPLTGDMVTVTARVEAELRP